MSTIDPSDIKVGRRTVLLTACATTCLAVAGCSTQNNSKAPGVTLGSAEVPISAVPVGGGVILADEQVVITQPQEGVFQAFSAVCTHQGCVVSEVSDGTINCPCHGSRYSIRRWLGRAKTCSEVPKQLPPFSHWGHDHRQLTGERHFRTGTAICEGCHGAVRSAAPRK